VFDPSDRCPGTLAEVKVDADGCEIEVAVLTGVNFETDSAKLTAGSAVVLDAVVSALRQRQNAKAQIHGYTDDRGQDAYNQKLSERRAAAVVEYLTRQGVSADSLGSQGHGETQPIASNSTAEGRAQNRRVTVQFSRVVPK
jgi:OOP family OmpA-OmpF porin